ncbi:MobV family relaxase [Bacillus fonticola]|uniref:MobV family relaxase n=1 Tax=Bacillus fonticola TaxID=2728853 RepID=UPI00147670F5|nr:MobV family relaxase [Bacillus fonticola]
MMLDFKALSNLRGKDAVKLCEFMVTSNKDFFEKLTPDQEEKFIKTSYDFLSDRYGKDNVVYAVVHKDEKTPHMHLGFVPVTEDVRLSAKEHFGQKLQLVQLQDDFNKHVKAQGFELDRGVSSDRKHVAPHRYKAKELEGQVAELKEEYSRVREQQEKELLAQKAEIEKTEARLVEVKQALNEIEVPL